MIDTNEVVQRLALHEGIRLMPYRCPAGYLTIGVGRNLETNPLTAEEQKVCGDYKHGITKNAAFFLLRNDIERTIFECEKSIPFFYHLDDERQYALVDMTFNMGIHRLLGFKKMLAALGVGNYKEAAAECLNSKYAREVKNRGKRIAHLIETGKWRI